MENIDKWQHRSRKAKDISVDSAGNIEGTSWDLVKKWQDEFQAEFCRSCIHFDPDKDTFKEIGHPKNALDCKSHYTDIIGQCWNYQNRENVQ